MLVLKRNPSHAILVPQDFSAPAQRFRDIHFYSYPNETTSFHLTNILQFGDSTYSFSDTKCSIYCQQQEREVVELNPKGRLVKTKILDWNNTNVSLKNHQVSIKSPQCSLHDLFCIHVHFKSQQQYIISSIRHLKVTPSTPQWSQSLYDHLNI